MSGIAAVVKGLQLRDTPTMSRNKARSNAFTDAAWTSVDRSEKTVSRDLTRAVVAGLLKSIDNEGVSPGDRLPSEWELCERFGVSRTVVREAVAQLRAQGRIESRRGSGMFVASLSSASPWVDLQVSERLSDVLDTLELRIAIEVESAGLAAERRSEAKLLDIYDALQRFQHAAGDSEASGEADFAFHRAIAVATGNTQFVNIMDLLRTQLIPRQVLGPKFASQDLRDAYQERIFVEHDAIYQSIADRDASRAKEMMRLHLEGSRKRYRDWRFATHSST